MYLSTRRRQWARDTRAQHYNDNKYRMLNWSNLIFFLDSAARRTTAAAAVSPGLGQQHTIRQALCRHPVLPLRRVPAQGAARLLLQGLPHRHVRVPRDPVPL
jgi:hypothetical protein